MIYWELEANAASSTISSLASRRRGRQRKKTRWLMATWHSRSRTASIPEALSGIPSSGRWRTSSYSVTRGTEIAISICPASASLRISLLAPLGDLRAATITFVARTARIIVTPYMPPHTVSITRTKFRARTIRSADLACGRPVGDDDQIAPHLQPVSTGGTYPQLQQKVVAAFSSISQIALRSDFRFTLGKQCEIGYLPRAYSPWVTSTRRRSTSVGVPLTVAVTVVIPSSTEVEKLTVVPSPDPSGKKLTRSFDQR